MTSRKEKPSASETVFESKAGELARLLRLAEVPPETWTQRDIAAMLQHQLRTRLEFDLLPLAEGRSDRNALARARAAGVSTFADLFQSPVPPKEVLLLAKGFFKTQAGRSSNRDREQEVAYLMYLVSIIVAKARLGLSISRLSPTDQYKAIQWARSRTWLDQATRGLLQQFSGSHSPQE